MRAQLDASAFGLSLPIRALPGGAVVTAARPRERERKNATRTLETAACECMICVWFSMSYSRGDFLLEGPDILEGATSY